MRTWLRVRIDWIAGLGVRDTDSEDVQLRKGALALSSVVISLFSCAWVAICDGSPGARAAAADSVRLPGRIPLVGLAVFARTKATTGSSGRASSPSILLLPFLLMRVLGGFVKSSSVAPVGAHRAVGRAVLLRATQDSIPWFAA